jgi:low affinity Fe/Cu permease
VHRFFELFASRTAQLLGSFWTFAACVVCVLIWLLIGPFVHFSSDWQLYINTISTIVTTLIVLIIQNTVNRGDKSLHLKLDELLRAKDEARTELIDLENMSEAELDKLREEFVRLSERKKSGQSTES